MLIWATVLLVRATQGAFRPGGQALSWLSFVPWGSIDPFYQAVVQATEEAVVNALVTNEDMTGVTGTAPRPCPATGLPNSYPPSDASPDPGGPNRATGFSQHTARSHALPRSSRASPAICLA